MKDRQKDADELARRAALPPRLRPGDRLGVIAPSGPALPAPLARGLEALATVFRVEVAASALAPAPPPHAPYLTAADEVRADETNRLLADPDVRGVVMARGGYGLMRILPRLDAAALRADPKPIVGFSDGTALLAWAHHAGVRGLHGEVAVRLGAERAEAIGELVRALTDPTPRGRLPWQLSAARADADQGIDQGVDEGIDRVIDEGDERIDEGIDEGFDAVLVPGNLVMAGHLVGTPWALPLAGAIYGLEEVGERPYELDRALTQLHLAGQLDRTAGVVIGDLVRCMDPLPGPASVDDPRSALAVVLERLERFGLPYLHGAHFGHGRYNPPLPFGGRCRFDRSAGALELLDGMVA